MCEGFLFGDYRKTRKDQRTSVQVVRQKEAFIYLFENEVIKDSLKARVESSKSVPQVEESGRNGRNVVAREERQEQ